MDENLMVLAAPPADGEPFQTKEDLRTRLWTEAELLDAICWNASSGSTGEPVTYPWSTHDELIAARTVARVHAADERLPGRTGMVIAPTGLSAMWGHMVRQLRHLGLTTVLPGVESPARIVALMQRLQPAVVISVPLVFSRIAEAFERDGATIPCRPDLLLTGGDVLSAARRERIEMCWGAPVRNCYGLSEVFGPLAATAPRGGRLEWQAEEVWVEVIDPHSRQSVPLGDTGVAVLTPRWPRPNSLRRYWTGDLFRLLDWTAPGRPAFEVRGRERLARPTGLEVVDLDELVLRHPEAGTEWAWEESDATLTIAVEWRGGAAGCRTLEEQIATSAGRRVVVCRAEPGTLDRSHAKLGARRAS